MMRSATATQTFNLMFRIPRGPIHVMIHVDKGMDRVLAFQNTPCAEVTVRKYSVQRTRRFALPASMYVLTSAFILVWC